MNECKIVGKISLWESQHELIETMFQWSETCSFHTQWYETQYEDNQEGCSKNEISFIFFLKKSEVKDFLRLFPHHLKTKIRFESFNIELYHYYQRKKQVYKHPDTP